jgi:hypothetical protein
LNEIIDSVSPNLSFIDVNVETLGDDVVTLFFFTDATAK